MEISSNNVILCLTNNPAYSGFSFTLFFYPESLLFSHFKCNCRGVSKNRNGFSWVTSWLNHYWGTAGKFQSVTISIRVNKIRYSQTWVFCVMLYSKEQLQWQKTFSLIFACSFTNNYWVMFLTTGQIETTVHNLEERKGNHS